MKKLERNSWKKNRLIEICNYLQEEHKDEIIHLSNGTILIKNLAEIGKLAFMHKIYAPLSNVLLKECEQKMQWPEWYSQFLQICNGLSLFRTTIEIHGIFMGRSSEDYYNFQPAPIELYEINERAGISKQYFIFGSADGVSKKLLYNYNSGNIEILDSCNSQIVQTFPDIVDLISFALVKAPSEFEKTHEPVILF